VFLVGGELNSLADRQIGGGRQAITRKIKGGPDGHADRLELWGIKGVGERGADCPRVCLALINVIRLRSH
jgi:hypothetical protein